MSTPRVEIVGAGVAGAACAHALRAGGVDVLVRERGRAPGGRLAAPALHGRRVDLGAAYFTVSHDDFGAVVADWHRRDLAREWTDTFEVAGGAAKTGPMRWAARDGLRSLARDLLTDIDVSYQDEVTSVSGPVVLAMPDPQAARVVPALRDHDWVHYDPVIAVVAGYAERCWQFADAAFVNDDPDITLVADDGARRGDGAPVLVVHTSAALAAAHLDEPSQVVAPVLAAVQRAVGIDVPPEWTETHRWTFAKPADTHGDAPFALSEELIGVCGDAWCPSGSPRVESAWLSGHRLGSELARRLG